MANGQYVGVNGVARKVTSPYIGVDGVARNVKSGYVGVDGVARLFFAPESGAPAVLEVKKITSDTYANETTYTAEEFFLLDIYPKTGGTVKVTYGGLTKTITDTSGAYTPNAQQVFFGTFNGVTDAVETPGSGTLTIEGDYYAFGYGTYAQDSNYKASISCCCITSIEDVGFVIDIPANAFAVHSYSLSSYKNTLKKVILKDGVERIGKQAFAGCLGLEQMTIPASVKSIAEDAWIDHISRKKWNGSFLSIDEGNPYYYFSGSCLIEKASKKLLSGFSDAVIPQGVQTICEKSFYGVQGMLADCIIPNGVTVIEKSAFSLSDGIVNLTIPSSVLTMYNESFSTIKTLERVVILAETPPTIPDVTYTTVNMFSKIDSLVSITVPKGCGATYKSHSIWKSYADYIVEAT